MEIRNAKPSQGPSLMLHARIAARAFNTPLLVEPTKAMAFLSGLGPRILGKRVELTESDDASDGTATLPARASILAGGLKESLRQHGDTPFSVVDGIAVSERLVRAAWGVSRARWNKPMPAWRPLRAGPGSRRLLLPRRSLLPSCR
jgi:hypothetical protein